MNRKPNNFCEGAPPPNTPGWGSLQYPLPPRPLSWTELTSLGLDLLDSPLPTPKLFSCITPGIKTHWLFLQKKHRSIYARLGKPTSEKIEIFKMRLRLSKSSRLLQRMAFLVRVFFSYSRNKLIKFDTFSIWCNVYHSPSIIIYCQSSSRKHKIQYLRTSQQKIC